MGNSIRIGLLLGTTLGATAISLPAYAQDAAQGNQGVEEIVVTALLGRLVHLPALLDLVHQLVLLASLPVSSSRKSGPAESVWTVTSVSPSMAGIWSAAALRTAARMAFTSG